MYFSWNESIGITFSISYLQIVFYVACDVSDYAIELVFFSLTLWITAYFL